MTRKLRTLLSLAMGVGLVAVLAVVGCQPAGGGVGLMENGPAMPSLIAEGWVNSPPAGGALRGNVVVIDCWFTACPPCQAAAPELVEAYRAYRDRGVQFMGLTFETSQELPAIRSFVRHFGTTWPIAYGAQPTLDALGVSGFPTLIVFGRDGRAVWRNDTMAGSLEQVLDEVLAE